MYCIVNGDLVDAKTAGLGINDLALQRGYGIFDYFKILDGTPIFLEKHLDRFYNSATQMHLEVGCPRKALIKMIFDLIDRNGLVQSGIKLLLTGGYSPDGFTMGKANLVITQGPLPTYSHLQDKGLRLITYKYERQMPEIKTIDYLMAVWLQPMLKESGANDLIYHDGKFISECPRSSIFIVTQDNRILTPARNVLKGIIRSQLLHPGNTMDSHVDIPYSISEADITIEDLYAAKEVFVTSTTKNILPVIQVDDKVINGGGFGAITLELAASLESQIEKYKRRSMLPEL